MNRRLFPLFVLAMLTLTTPAQATYPGENGKVAFSTRFGDDTSNEIYTVDPTTSGLLRLTDAPGDDVEPSWNPDGTEIVFASTREDAAVQNCMLDPCSYDLYTVSADGTTTTRLTTTPEIDERQPAWSPDGGQIAFTSEDRTTLRRSVGLMDADGSDSHLLFGSASEQARDPSWSPQGDRLAFDRHGDVWVGDSDGGNQRFIGAGDEANWSPYNDFVLVREGNFTIKALSPDSARPPVLISNDRIQRHAVWSPDMERIALAGDAESIHLIWPDGTHRVPFVVSDGTIQGIDWLAVPTPVLPGHVRPMSATKLRVSLVPATGECTAPNREHGPPLSFPSCSPPGQSPPNLLTVGTPDANGKPARSVGAVTITTVTGDPATHADEADVRLTLEVSDVRRRSNLADYSGGLLVPLEVRATDKYNGCCGLGGPEASTVGEGNLDLAFGASCATTPDPDEGSTCTVTTTVEAITPAAVLEGLRTTWQLGQIKVYAISGGGPEPFAVQGLFVP